jgi:hypothetical protein
VLEWGLQVGAIPELSHIQDRIEKYLSEDVHKQYKTN